ncbi:hypothetical protein STIAU_3112, partial [Stigmatella aurantiaca DW4/3-1]
MGGDGVGAAIGITGGRGRSGGSAERAVGKHAGEELLGAAPPRCVLG